MTIEQEILNNLGHQQRETLLEPLREQLAAHFVLLQSKKRLGIKDKELDIGLSLSYSLYQWVKEMMFFLIY